MAPNYDQFHDRNVTRVKQKFHERSLRGIARYGTDTARNKFNHRRWLVELQEELMDAVVYLEAAIDKLDQ